MKKKDLLLMAVVFMLFSCCSNESDKYGKTSALYIKSVYSVSQEADARTYAGEDSLVDPKESVDTGEEYNEYEIKPDSLWTTGDNIKWYNGTTGKIEFKVRPPLMRGFPPFFYQYLVVFLDDKELIRFETVTGISSIATARPCITEEEDGYYISKGYPRWDPMDRNESTAHWDWDEIDAPREKNWKAIEPEWNIFIEQLKKEGKYRE
jgi:hypothetical protein